MPTCTAIPAPRTSLKAQYGNGATEESYRQYVTLNALASAYRNSYSSSLTYTDADLRR